MNYYERIQKSIDYIEDNLCEEITVEECAKEAYMSVSGYYRLFLSTVGYSVKEYVRMRRLTMALCELQNSNESVLDVAVKYVYNSADSFTRAFKGQFGILPSKVKSVTPRQVIHEFERINLMEKYFDTENTDLIEKYPDIKVIRKLEDMKVACFTYYGEGPEGKAFAEVKKWVHKNSIHLSHSPYRIFGYNNPDPTQPDVPYAYEVCVTIPDNLYDTLEDAPQEPEDKTYDCVKRRILRGGEYAVMSVKRDENNEIGTNIMLAWKRFIKWMDEGKYVWGGNQYLEEHVGFSEEDDHIGGVELYISIQEAPKTLNQELKEVKIPCNRVVKFEVTGQDSDQVANACWRKALTWAKENSLVSKECRVFQYNNGFDQSQPRFHQIMIMLPEHVDISSLKKMKGVEITTLNGGKFVTATTNLKRLGETWMTLEKMRQRGVFKAGNHQWLEEWRLKNWSLPAVEIIVCYPILS